MSASTRNDLLLTDPGPGKSSGNGDKDDTGSGTSGTGDPGDYNVGDDVGERIGEGHDVEVGNDQQR